MKLFQTWCKELGIKDPNLGTLPPIHKERIFVSYALDISQSRNHNKLPSLGVKCVQNYLRAAASHATNKGQRDPRLQYTPYSLPLDGAKPFPMLRKLISHMSKWSDGRYEALPLTTAILGALEARYSSWGLSYKAECIFDAICLGH